MAYKGRKSANKILPFAPRPRMVENISAPSYLAPEEQKLCNSIASDYDIRSDSAAIILEIAMQQHARARVCREVIKKEGLMIPGANGAKAHPLLNTERQAHQQMLAALRRLGATIDEG